LEIIAEIAQGYEGNQKLAELLLRGAIASNADAVKVQLVYADELCVPDYPYYDLFKNLEMPVQVWKSLVTLAHSNNRRFYFDVYGPQSLELAMALGADGVKISTTDFYNTALIDRAFSSFSRVYISIGGADLEEIKALVSKKNRPQYLTLMHGFQAEPTPIEENNLLRVKKLKEYFPNLGIGFMDHSDGEIDDALYLPILALGLGFDCLEKHISLDHALGVEDHVSALTVDTFSRLVSVLNRLRVAMGTSSFELSKGEREYKNRAGKIVVARKDIKVGEVLSYENITLKRVSLKNTSDTCRGIDELFGLAVKTEHIKNSPILKSNLLT
jgi:N,N'-diacetyllegionaminate synthase